MNKAAVAAFARLAVVLGTTHTGLCASAEWVVPMIAEFLGRT